MTRSEIPHHDFHHMFDQENRRPPSPSAGGPVLIASAGFRRGEAGHDFVEQEELRFDRPGPGRSRSVFWSATVRFLGKAFVFISQSRSRRQSSIDSLLPPLLIGDPGRLFRRGRSSLRSSSNGHMGKRLHDLEGPADPLPAQLKRPSARQDSRHRATFPPSLGA